MNDALLHIGTCSWKYDSWIGLIYHENAKQNYLKEYANHYNTVEIDQWFWSLHTYDKVKLPDVQTVKAYYDAVPEYFKFSIKVPNSLTLTHYYKQNKNDTLIENPYFLSSEVFEQFLYSITELKHKTGPLMFQFEYLNKQKMPDQERFLNQLQGFFSKTPSDFDLAVEIRNTNYLNEHYFKFLKSLNISHVFLQGYFMPPIVSIYEKFRTYIETKTIIRLHGPNRKEIESLTRNKWNKIVASKDHELDDIATMTRQLLDNNIEIYLNVNNHYEGSAPLTIEKLSGLLN